ncbi:DUF7848 domain-containing protein [Streptomyces violascens]
MSGRTPTVESTEVPGARQPSRGTAVVRQTFGYVNWTLRPNREPDAPPTRFKFRCLTEDESGKPCGTESKESENFAIARDWTFAHMQSHPTHVSYAEVVVRPWAMWRIGPTR